MHPPVLPSPSQTSIDQVGCSPLFNSVPAMYHFYPSISRTSHPFSKPLPRRLRTRTLRHAPLIPSPLPQPLLRTQLQLALQLITRLLPVNEITKPAPHTPLAAIQPTARLAKIRHGAQLAVYRPCRIPATIQRVARLLRRVLVLEARVDIPDQMIVIVVADDDFLDLAVLAHLGPEVFVEGVEVVLELGGVHFVLRVVGRVLVEVGQEDGLGVGGLDVFA